MLNNAILKEIRGNMRVENLSKIYEKKGKKIIALQNINYSFEPGKMYAITGESGSGKTTLIKVLGLIESSFTGNYLINNIDVKNVPASEKCDIRKNDIGFIFQDFLLDENLRAYENLILPMLINKNIPKEIRKKKAIDMLKEMGLEERLNHYPHEMSGGEKQRVAIARALVNNPSYILADESTGSLDENNEIIIFEILKKLSRDNKTIIVVTHSPKIKEYADVMLVLQNGKLVKDNDN